VAKLATVFGMTLEKLLGMRKAQVTIKRRLSGRMRHASDPAAEKN
jgi:hypothetical protein